MLALIVSTLLRLCLLTIQLNDPQTLYFEVMLKMEESQTAHGTSVCTSVKLALIKRLPWDILSCHLQQC